MNTFSKKEAFAFGWQRFKERPFFLIGLFILTTVISAITGFVAEEINTGFVGVTVSIVDFSIQIIIGIGMTLILLRVYDQADTNYADLIEPLNLFWKYLVMTILVLVVVLMGLVLFVIPGIIAGIALSFASYIIVDRNLGPVDAMKESIHITQGHRWNLFIFGLTILFVNILGALFFGVGLLVTIPVSALATVHVYRWLSNPPEEVEGVSVGILQKIFSVAVVSLFVVVALSFIFGLFGGSTQDAYITAQERDVQRYADIVDIKLGAALYYDVEGVFPAKLHDLSPNYMESIPVDPLTEESYLYNAYQEGVDYELCTVLETVEEFGGLYCEYGLDLGPANTEV